MESVAVEGGARPGEDDRWEQVLTNAPASSQRVKARETIIDDFDGIFFSYSYITLQVNLFATPGALHKHTRRVSAP